MKKLKRQVSQSEAMKTRWKRRIVMEKSYPESTAQWMAERLERLLDHMLYGHAMIAYHKQNGDFKFVKGTLVYYEAEFHKAYDPAKIDGAIVYWDVEQQGWRTFLVENFMEWRPIQQLVASSQ